MYIWGVIISKILWNQLQLMERNSTRCNGFIRPCVSATDKVNDTDKIGLTKVLFRVAIDNNLIFRDFYTLLREGIVVLSIRL